MPLPQPTSKYALTSTDSIHQLVDDLLCGRVVAASESTRPELDQRREIPAIVL